MSDACLDLPRRCVRCGGVDFNSSGACRPCTAKAAAKSRVRYRIEGRSTLCRKCGGLDFDRHGHCRPCTAAYQREYLKARRALIAENAALRTKPCVRCGAVDFNHSGRCRPCARAATARYQKANAQPIKARIKERAASRTEPCEKCGAFDFDAYGQCKPCTAAWHREYRKTNRAHVKARTARTARSRPCRHCGGTNISEWGKCLTCHAAREAAWRRREPEKWAEAQKRARETRRRKDPSRYLVQERMSCAVRVSLKRYAKAGKNRAPWAELVGYGPTQLAAHLKRTLPDGWSWQDFLDGKMDIDHIIPVSAHNFSTAECADFKRCWSMKNLRLLPSRENRSKGAKLIAPFQPSLL